MVFEIKGDLMQRREERKDFAKEIQKDLINLSGTTSLHLCFATLFYSGLWIFLHFAFLCDSFAVSAPLRQMPWLSVQSLLRINNA